MTAVADEFFAVPPLTDTEYWDRVLAVGLHQPDPTQNGHPGDGYTWINLTDPAYSIPPDPPTIKGILYAGRRHVISGPPESTKTLIAYMLLLEALRQNEGVCILDFEMGPHAAATLLRELGASQDELANIHYAEPDRPPSIPDIQRIIGLGVGYCLVDAAAGAYDATGLDDNKRQDAETFASKWIRPLWQQGIATIVIDHVVKAAENRGKFAIGSERKTGQADVHLSLETLKPLHRGSDGLVKIRVYKDRPGHLPRPTLAVIELHSSPDTHNISWNLQAFEEPDEQHEFRPTRLMQKVSRYLGQQDEPESRNSVFKALGGRKQWVLAAIDILCHEGFAEEVTGGVKHVRHYLENEDPTLVVPAVPDGSQVVPGTSAGGVVPVVPGGSAPHGAAGTTETPQPNPGTPKVVPGSDQQLDNLLQHPETYDQDIPF